jgi:hypothetical protein
VPIEGNLIMGKQGKCKLSFKFCPSLDEHHVIPREYGGEDGPTVLLTPEVHQLLHRSVSDLETRELFIKNLPRQTQRYALQFIETIIRAKKEYEQKNPEEATETITLTLPKVVKQKLKLLAKDKGLSTGEFIVRLLSSIK